ncbi:MAG: VWA domain-containing protein [Spirochaetes bacterium]|nr:VWA domain-containing protein [Spirochaetota bacterium]
MKTDKILQEPDIRLLSKLSGLGLTRNNYHAIFLLPAVYVALAGNEITEKQNREIIGAAGEFGFTGGEEAGLVIKWLSEGVREDLMEEGIRKLFMLMSTASRTFRAFQASRGRKIRRITALAKRVAGASIEKSGKYSGRDTLQRTALKKIRVILQSIRGPWWTWPVKIISRRISNWKIVDDASGVSGFPASDPFLFTSSGAIRDYQAGKFNRPGGAPYLLADLEKDLRTEVMRMGDWKEEDLRFRAVLERLLEEGLIEDTGLYWNVSPHSVIYLINHNVKIRILGREYRLYRGKYLVFQCRMARDAHNLDGPFITGLFAPYSESMLCREMANSMLGKGRNQSLVPGPGGRRNGPLPEIDLSGIRIDHSVRVIYLLIDTSSSMFGRSLEQAKTALFSFMRLIVPSPGLRVAIRSFSTKPGRLKGSLVKSYTPAAKDLILKEVNRLKAEGSTALFKTVRVALDDIQSSIRDHSAYQSFLIVLSDGQDNQGLQSYGYRTKSGKTALAERMTDFRNAGIIEYLPMAYGGRIESLEEIGGTDFRAGIVHPETIVQSFVDIGQYVMMGMPGGSMAGLG